MSKKLPPIYSLHDAVTCLQDYASAQGFGMGSRSYDPEFSDIVSYSADDQVVGQYYIALAESFPGDATVNLEPVTTRLDHIYENPSDVDLDHSIRSMIFFHLMICSIILISLWISPFQHALNVLLSSISCTGDLACL